MSRQIGVVIEADAYGTFSVSIVEDEKKTLVKGNITRPSAIREAQRAFDSISFGLARGKYSLEVPEKKTVVMT